MSTSDSAAIEAAVTWMRAQLASVPFGRIGVAVQTSHGKITKVFRTLEDSLIAGPGGEVGQDHGAR